jgi:hypothetical protein
MNAIHREMLKKSGMLGSDGLTPICGVISSVPHPSSRDWQGRLREEAAQAVVLAQQIVDHLPQLRVGSADPVEEGGPLLARQVESLSEKPLGGFVELIHPSPVGAAFLAGKPSLHSTTRRIHRGQVSGVK